MRFIKLHYDDGRPIYMNPDNIDYIVEVKGITQIYIATRLYAVRETVHDVIKKLEEAMNAQD